MDATIANGLNAVGLNAIAIWNESRGSVNVKPIRYLRCVATTRGASRGSQAGVPRIRVEIGMNKSTKSYIT